MIGPAEIRELLAEYEVTARADAPSWPKAATMWPVFVDERAGRSTEAYSPDMGNASAEEDDR